MLGSLKACESECVRVLAHYTEVLDPRNPFSTIRTPYPQWKIVFVVCDPEPGRHWPIYSAVVAATAFFAALPAARRALLAAFSSSVMAA